MDEMADAMEEDDPDFIPTENFKGEDGVGPTPSHSCSFCEFSAKTAVGLANHQRNKHKDSFQHKCDDCGESFQVLQWLFKHSLEQHNGLKCNLCEKRFVDRNCYHRHIKIEHEGCRYECKLCGKEFRNAQTLRDHRNIHLGIKPFMCHKCDAAFTNSHCLGRHIRKRHRNKLQESSEINDGNQEYETVKIKTLCNECGKEFNSKGALTKHIKTHQTDRSDVDTSILREHLKDRVLTFANSHTLEETAEKFNLNQRVIEDWLKIATRQFCCEFCSKAFAARWRLTEHQKRLHFTKEEWAMSVEGRHQRQNVENVKLDVMPSL